MEREIILDEEVANDLKSVRAIVSKAGTKRAETGGRNLYTAIVEQLSEGTRQTEKQLDYLNIYEKALSVFRTASFNLRTAMDTQTLQERLGVLEESLGERSIRVRIPVQEPQSKSETVQSDENTAEKDKTKRDILKEQITESVGFSNRYALYFAGQVGLSLLESQKAAGIQERLFFGTEYEASENRDGLTSLLAQNTTEDLIRVIKTKRAKNQEISDDDLKFTLENIFTTWVNQFNWGTFKEIAKSSGIEDAVLKYDNFSVKEGEFSRKYDVVLVEGRFMNAKVDDLIAQEEHTKRMQQLLYRLLGWDEKRKDNPFSPPTVVAIHGEPGCGKTMSAHAYVNWFIEECKKLKKPLLAIQHSIDDYGSKFQNETPIKLSARRDKIRDFPGVAILQASDIDTFMPESRSKEPTQEENKVNGIYFSMFDNSRIPAGKFMAILDANHIDNIDPALKSRFGERIELARFTKPEDFVKYSRIYLTKNSQGVGISDPEWIELGKYLLNSNLSNREIANVINNLRGGFEVTPEVITKPYEEQVKFRNDYLKSITLDTVRERFDKFIATTQQMERQSREAKLRDRQSRYATDLVTVPEKGKSNSGVRRE
jgi:hypothetical protein